MRFKGNGVVWDRELDQVLVKFNKKGEIEVTDESVIQKLLALGFVPDAPNYIDVEFTEVTEEPIPEVEELTRGPEVNHVEEPKEPKKRTTKKKI